MQEDEMRTFRGVFGLAGCVLCSALRSPGTQRWRAAETSAGTEEPHFHLPGGRLLSSHLVGGARTLPSSG